MASIILRLDERTTKNGMQHVRLRISHKGTNAWHPTGVWVEPAYFNRSNIYEAISKRAPMAAFKREQLSGILRQYEEGLFDLQRADGGNAQLDQMTANELRDYIFGTRDKKPTAVQLVAQKKKTTQTGDFMAFFDQYGQGRRSERTREHFAYVWRVLLEYINARGLRELRFADINYARLTDMKAWLRTRRSGEETRFKVESYVRAAYREGLRMGKCDRALDPFYDYRIDRVPEHDIETISREQVKTLMEYDKRPGLQRAKDVLLASFYLCGVNFVDLYDMPLPVDGSVSFVRSKVSGHTQKATCIRVEPELERIIERYGGDGRLLNFTANMRTLQCNLNDNYRELSKELGFKVNMAMIRRTWATLAAEIECPDAVIDMCLGHMPRTINSLHYVKPNWERAANWNRKVIDYVLAA